MKKGIARNMRKTIAMALAITLCAALLAACKKDAPLAAYIDEPNVPNAASAPAEPAEDTPQETPDAGLTPAAELVEWIKAGTYSFQFMLYNNELINSISTAVGELSVQGDDSAMALEVWTDTDLISIRIVTVGGETYVIDENTLTVLNATDYFTNLSYDLSSVMDFGDEASLELSAQGSDFLAGEQFLFEEYVDSNGIRMKIFYSGDAVSGLVVSDSGETIVTMIIFAYMTDPIGGIFAIPDQNPAS